MDRVPDPPGVGVVDHPPAVARGGHKDIGAEGHGSDGSGPLRIRAGVERWRQVASTSQRHDGERPTQPAAVGDTAKVGGQDRQMTESKPSGSGALFADTPYEYGTVVPAGAILFTAGACPLDADGNVVGPGDHVTQAGVALENLTMALARYGARLQDIVKTTVYVVGDRNDLHAVWDVVASGLAPYRPPSTLLGIATLGYAAQLVEIEGVASLGSHPSNS